MHVGWGDWIIVDSCIAPDGNTPASIAYLKRLDVEPSTAVRRVVATHWHNDHVRGLTQTMKDCAGAKFICSQALFTKEFIALTDLWRRQQLATSPVSELTGVIDTIARSTDIVKGSNGDGRLGFAVADRCLWRRPQANESEIDTTAELHSLSPSDAAVTKSLEAISGLFPTEGTLTQPMPSRPNQFSVALWLRVGDVRLLLGADLEEINNPFGGWKLIVDSKERPAGPASLFKVPHHGSVTGECESVWTRMLLRNPVAMLTPFQRGRVRLPTEEDAARILDRTSVGFITAPFRAGSSRGRTGSVNRTIQETVRYIRRANSTFGHIQARKKLTSESSEWSVTTFGNARPLSELYGNRSL